MTKQEFYEFIDSFKKNPGEYTSEEVYEIGKVHKALSMQDRNWGELVKILGLNKTGNALRKYVAYHMNLDEKQKEMYAKVTGLTYEMDIERGVGHAR